MCSTRLIPSLIAIANILALLSLSACQPINSTSEPTIVRPHPTSTLSAPVASATSFNPPTHTSTTQPTSTATPAPTLSVNQRASLMEELLATNKDCKLPCWWGVSPGVSKWMDVEDFILSIGAKTGQQSLSNDLILHETGGFDLPEKGIRNRISFIESSANVIAIRVAAEGRTNPEAFKEIWASYWPDKILSDYGKPSRVLLKTFSRAGESSPVQRTIYGLWMFYDDKGVLIRYSGTVIFDATYRICPSYAESGNLVPDIELYLQSPTNSMPIDDLARDGLTPETSIRPLEDATGVSIDQFSELLLNDPQNFCVETPRDIWP